MRPNILTFFSILLFSALFFSCKQQKNAATFNLSGNINNYQKSTLILVQEVDINRKQNSVVGEIPIDKNGNFDMDFNLEPHIYTLSFDDKKKVTLAIDKGQKIVINGDAADWSTVKVSGSADTEKLEEYEAFRKKSLDSLVISVREQIKKLKEANSPANDAEIADLSNKEIENYNKHKGELINFIEKNMGSSIAVYPTSLRWDGDQNMSFLEKLSADFAKAHPDLSITKKVIEKVEILKNTSIGGTAKEIKMPDKNGKEIALFESNAKYILIDFWASWCAPCRQESKELYGIYQRFNPKGFEIYGIGLETEKENWLKAIEKDNRIWTNVTTLQEFETPVTYQYAVTSLPANFLIDLNGKIIGKNLHGEQLREKVESLFVE